MKRKQEIYVAPTIKVVEMKVRHTLLAGSDQLQRYGNGGRINDWSEGEE